jgi:hypothetical protein
MGVHLTGRASHGRVPYGVHLVGVYLMRVSCGRVSRGRVSRGRASHRTCTSWACTSLGVHLRACISRAWRVLRLSDFFDLGFLGESGGKTS